MSARVDHRTGPSWRLVWPIVTGATVMWALRFTLGYLFVPAACELGDWLLHTISLVLLLAAAGVLLANVLVLRRGADPPKRFLLLVGVGVNGFFTAVMLLEGSAVLWIDACAKAAVP